LGGSLSAIPEMQGASIFGIKFCHPFAKAAKNEGISVDVVENKRTENGTLGFSVDVDGNKGT